jgi:hypothetical protein
MLKLFEFSTKNVLVWIISLLVIAIYWFITVSLLMFLETSPPLIMTLTVFLIAFIFSVITHLGLLLSTFINNPKIFSIKFWINLLIVIGIVSLILLIFNVRFLAGNSDLIIYTILLPTISSLFLHIIQFFSLLTTKRMTT